METRKLYGIRLIGRDDSTEFEMELTPCEALVVDQVSQKSLSASEYESMPILRIREQGKGEPCRS